MSTGMITGTLLLAVLALPLAMLAVAAVPRTRIRVAEYLPLAPLPALVAALAIPHGTEIALPQSLLGLTLIHDTSGAMLLGAASLLWVAGGIWARRLVGYPDGQFVIWWLITLTGSLGVFIAVSAPLLPCPRFVAERGALRAAEPDTSERLVTRTV